MGRPDGIADGEAMSIVEGGRLDEILARAEVVSMQDEPQRAAWNGYRVAFRTNEAEPTLGHAVALVKAWNRFAVVMGIEQRLIRPHRE
jgi:hypothetical protein